MSMGRASAVLRLPLGVKAATLVVSLVLSAMLTAVALRVAEHYWLAWISFLPLFVAVRWFRPPLAVLTGALWGACLHLFCIVGPTPAIGPSAWLLALLIVIPAVYVGLAALPTRAIGFKLLTLALGWTLVEAVVHLQNPLGPHEGLLIGSHGDGPRLHWLARLLGYVCTAFLLAWANESLVGILSGARLCLPASRSLTGLPSAGGCPAAQAILAIQSWTLRLAHPRAPPLPVAALC